MPSPPTPRNNNQKNLVHAFLAVFDFLKCIFSLVEQFLSKTFALSCNKSFYIDNKTNLYVIFWIFFSFNFFKGIMLYTKEQLMK